MEPTTDTSRWSMSQQQFDRLSALLHRVYDSSEYYRQRFDTARFHPAEITDYEKFRAVVPLMRKDDVLDEQRAHPPFGRMLAVDSRDLVQINMTSGTSGRGSEVFGLTRRDLTQLSGAFAAIFSDAGARPGDGLALTFPMSFGGGPSWVAAAASQLDLNLMHLGAYDTDSRIKHLSTFRPRFLVGTPSYLQALATEATSRGIDVPEAFGIEALFTATEAFSTERAAKIESLWGAKLYEWYGSSQRALAFNCAEGALHDDGTRGLLHHRPDLVLLETLDPESGEPVEYGQPGEVVVTYLLAEASPLIRYATGDRATLLPGSSCPCAIEADGYRTGDIGRYDDMLKVRGINLWPSAADQLILGQPGVTDYRAVVHSESGGAERISISVEFESDVVDVSDRAKSLEGLLRHALGLSMIVGAADGSLGRFDDPGRKARRWSDQRIR